MKTSRIARIAALALGLSAATQAAYADGVTTLRLSHFLPPSHPLQASFQEWAAKLEKDSGGTLRVTIFPAEQLGKAFDDYDVARDGIADIALVGPGYQPGRFPVAGAADLPFLYNDGKCGTAAVDAWYRPYAAAEMKGVHFCVGFIQGPATLHSRTPVALPTDLKGLKVRPPNAVIGGLVTDFDGTNVSAPPQQTRELIDRGVVGAGGAFLIGLARRRLPRQAILQSLLQATRTAAAVFTVLIGALLFGYFLAVTGTPQKVTIFLTGLGLGRYGVLMLVLLMYLVLGCLMDAMAMIILTLPIVFPAITSLGFDPIGFGVIIVMTVELGLIHPPVGMNVFVIKTVVPEVTFAAIFRGVVPFIVTDLVRLALLVSFPVLVLWLT